MVEEEKESTIDHMIGRLLNFKFGSAAGYAEDLTRKERKIIGIKNLKMINKLSRQYSNVGCFDGSLSNPISKWIEKLVIDLTRKGVLDSGEDGPMQSWLYKKFDGKKIVEIPYN